MSSRRGPGPPWSVSPPWRASSRRKRPLGGVGPWGLSGGLGTVSRRVAAGPGARGGWCGVRGVVSSVRRRFTVLPLAGGVSRRPAGPARLPPPASAVPSFPAARPRSEPASRPPPPPPRGSRPVGTGGSRPRPSPCAHPRPGDACPGGDPRDAAASARRCALSPRAVAVPRFAPPSPRCARAWPGAAAGAGGDQGCARRVCRPCGLRRPCVPRPPARPPPSTSAAPPPRPSRDRRLVLPPRPASVSPSLPPPPAAPAGARRRPPPAARRRPQGRRVGGGAWYGDACVRVVCECVWRGRRGGVPGRSAAGLSVPFSGPSSRAPSPRARVRARAPSETRPQIRRGDPLNLSILVSGGKETNQDSLSNGE